MLSEVPLPEIERQSSKLTMELFKALETQTEVDSLHFPQHLSLK